MDEYLVYYRYNGVTNEFRFLAESEEHAMERVLLFKANKEEPRIHCNGNVTGDEARAISST